MAHLHVNDVIEETLPLVQSQAIGQRVTMHLELASELPEILADRIQLQQVLINLVINAIDAMKAHAVPAARAGNPDAAA